jgi:hypothetical protein
MASIGILVSRSLRKTIPIPLLQQTRGHPHTMLPFGIKNAHVVFSQTVVAYFSDYIDKFLEVYLNDWTRYSLLEDNVALLTPTLNGEGRYNIFLISISVSSMPHLELCLATLYAKKSCWWI